MRYIVLDTNIYVYCALASIERHKSELLHRLCDLLDDQDNALIVPEIVELEFPRVLERERVKYDNIVSGALADLEQLALSKSDKQILKKARSEITELRNESIADGRSAFIDLLGHSSTIRLQMTSDVLSAAMRLSVTGAKPSKGRSAHLDAGYVLEPDCAIVASIRLALEDGTLTAPGPLSIVTNNIDDFAVVTDKDATIHPDLQSYLNCEIAYYRGLPSLINTLNEAQKMSAEQVSRYDEVVERLTARERLSELTTSQMRSLHDLYSNEALLSANAERLAQMERLARPSDETLEAFARMTANVRPSGRVLEAIERLGRMNALTEAECIRLIGTFDRHAKRLLDAELDAAAECDEDVGEGADD